MLKLKGVVPPSGWYRSHCGTTNPRITPHARRRSVRYSVPRLANPAWVSAPARMRFGVVLLVLGNSAGAYCAVSRKRKA